jgi:Zn-dependent peptidase ImmA (M78 family)
MKVIIADTYHYNYNGEYSGMYSLVEGRYYGMFFPVDHTIVINTSLKKKPLLFTATLIHEMLHAFFYFLLEKEAIKADTCKKLHRFLDKADKVFYKKA